MPSTNTVFHTTNTGGNAQISNLNVNGDYVVSNIYQVTYQKQREVYGWLGAPDSSSNYHAAREKHHADTGSWFIEGTQFLGWKETPDWALWIYGTPGCGKTIICSTAVDEILDHCAANGTSTHACAYFFFDNRSSQNDLSLHHKLIRSLIRQLSHQSGGIPESLMKIYGGGHQQPSMASLQLTLRRIIEGFEHVYIIVDALDECADRMKVLAWIEKIMQWHGGKLHILLSSRPEVDIKEKFDFMPNVVRVSLTWSPINEDIKTYVGAMLLEMTRWDEKTRAYVGSFDEKRRRNILELSRCRSRRAVDMQLQTMPKDLDATYEKMLTSSTNPQDLKQFLLWLAFSHTTLKAEELEDVITVDFSSKDGPSFDLGLRYFGTADVLDMCSGFIAEHAIYDHECRKYRGITLAHMSVKDYLISERIKSGAASYLSIDEMLSHTTIAQACLACLLHLGTFSSPDETTIESLPLAQYAADSWVAHMYSGRVDDEDVAHMIDRLFSPKGNALINLVRLNDPDVNLSLRVGKIHSKTASHLYYASSYGLEATVERLLTTGADVAVRGGKYRNSLQAASCHGHDRVVKSLLDHGTDVNAQEGDYGNALQAAAACKGNIEVVQLLLDSGADVNIQGGQFGNALMAASNCSDVEVVQLLLDRGADVNIPGGSFGNALQPAAFNGHIELVKLFIDRGADMNAHEGDFGNALQAAASSNKGPIEVVQLLLDRGADLNAQGGPFGNALQPAAFNGRIDLVKLFLDRGADVNVPGGCFGTALQAASTYAGNFEVVQLLLDRGADVKSPGGRFGSALQSAAYDSSVRIVQLLLDHDADVNAQGGDFSSALQAASCTGHAEVVQLLLDHGADVNAQGGHFGNALEAASRQRQETVVRLLLEHGADVNAIGGPCGSALAAASAGCHTDIVQLLLSKGVDVQAQGARALRFARGSERHVDSDFAAFVISREDRRATVQLLLDGGAVAEEGYQRNRRRRRRH